MDRNGMLVRNSFEQLARVEHCYRTPRCFDYYMSRLSGEEWQREQREDGVADAPITLESLEQPSRHEPIAKMLASDLARRFHAPAAQLLRCLALTDYPTGY